MIFQSNPQANYLAHRQDIDAAIQRVLQSGWYILGSEVRAFEQEFAAAMGAHWSVGVANGTDAIELALRACGVNAGDFVLTVSHTAVATVSAISRVGARPLFVDIDPVRYTMDPSSLRAVLLTPAGRAAKAVVVVHLYGQPADMSAIASLTRDSGLALIEDCAQAHGALLDGKPVGSWGDAGCYSFYPTKNLGALGDGGAVVGSDEELGSRIRLLREYGWRTRYVSECAGINSRLDELQAAVLRAKLPHLATENECRRQIASFYSKTLAESGVTIPAIAPSCQHVFHQYVIRSSERDRLRQALHDEGVGTLVHYPLAVHQQPAYADPQFAPVPLLNTELIIKDILSLPMYPELSEEQVMYVVERIIQIEAVSSRIGE